MKHYEIRTNCDEIIGTGTTVEDAVKAALHNISVDDFIDYGTYCNEVSENIESFSMFELYNIAMSELITMNKMFKVEYNPINEYGSEWFTVDDYVEAETEDEAIELAKDCEIERARNFGLSYEAATEEINNYSWRATEA